MNMYIYVPFLMDGRPIKVNKCFALVIHKVFFQPKLKSKSNILLIIFQNYLSSADLKRKQNE